MAQRIAQIDPSRSASKVFTAQRALRLCQILVCGGLLYLHKFPEWPFVLCGMLACSLFPRWRLNLLMIFSVGSWFFLSKFNWQYVRAFAQEAGINIPGGFFAIQLVCMTLAGAIIASLYLLSHSLKKRDKIKSGTSLTLYCGLALFLFILLVDATSLSGQLRFWVWSPLHLFCYLFWYVAFGLVSYSRGVTNWRLQLTALFPIWNQRVTPVPGGAEELVRYEFQTSQNLLSRSLKLLLYTLILKFFISAYEQLLFTEEPLWILDLNAYSLRLPNPRKLGYESINESDASIATLWVGFVFNALSLMLKAAVHFGSVVAVAWVFGVDCPQQVDRPWRAKTFGEFWSRWLHYYSQVVRMFFIFPLRDVFGTISSVRRRAQVATFTGVFLAGFLFHFFQEVPLIERKGSGPFLLSYLSMAPYFLTIAMLVTLSHSIRKKPFFRSDALLFVICRTVLFFSVYVFLYSLVVVFYWHASWSDYTKFLEKMY